ncbi:MAG TPA: N-acetyltransferase [Actinomycetota bacterium]|nr:N-acetyltransferase [Actinomycetota bacterium]
MSAPTAAPFVPDGFDPPTRLDGDGFWLEPLGPEHNVADHAAWMSSIEHIRATPGWAGRDWPHEMSLDDNLRDLEEHEKDFRARTGFTYTVRSSGDGDVIGCVYIYPDRERDTEAHVSSWVRASHAELDPVLADAVTGWLRRDWPFGHVRYAARG